MLIASLYLYICLPFSVFKDEKAETLNNFPWILHVLIAISHVIDSFGYFGFKNKQRNNVEFSI